MARDIKGIFEGVLDAHAAGKESKLETHSRRVWLQNFAAVSATAGVVWACGSKSKDNATGTPGCTAAALTADQKTTEVNGLNAALSLENEAINIYTGAAGVNAVWDASGTGVALAPTFLAIAKVFLAHHQAHAAQLTTQIKALGGTPVAANSADTDLAHYPGISGLTGATGLAAVLGAAAERELNAAKAYYSLVKSLNSQDDVNIVADIAPDEAAHYGVLIAGYFVVAGTNAKVDQNSIVPGALADGFTIASGVSPRT